MKPDLDYLSNIVDGILKDAPDYDQADWDRSFAARSKFFRQLIADLGEYEGAKYAGMVGDHSLTLGGISVRVRDGYRQLLEAWRSAVPSGEAVAS